MRLVLKSNAQSHQNHLKGKKSQDVVIEGIEACIFALFVLLHR